MFCTDSCHKQPLGEVLHSVEICFVTSLLKNHQYCNPISKGILTLQLTQYGLVMPYGIIQNWVNIGSGYGLVLSRTKP